MAKALGIGGVFFKCKDLKKLAKWYKEYLDFPLDSEFSAPFKPHDMPREGYTVWAVFKESTDYFNPSGKEFMINIVVDDLEGALSQVKEGGAQIIGAIEEFDYGRFGWFIDPEGNKVELWHPAKS